MVRALFLFSFFLFPLINLCSIPVPTETQSTRLNIQALESLINTDIEEAKMPAILIARVGTHLTGGVDDIKTLRQICDKHNIWLHVEGFEFPFTSI